MARIMFDILPYPISCQCCAFMNIRDHAAVAECSKLLSKIAQDPQSVTHGIVHIRTLKLLRYNPKYVCVQRPLEMPECKITHLEMQSDIKGLTNLRNLEFLHIHVPVGTLTSLTNLTHITYYGDFKYSDRLPSSIRSIRIIHPNSQYLDLFIKQISKFAISNLELHHRSVPDISHLRLKSLTLMSHVSMKVPKLHIPTLQELRLDLINWYDAIEAIQAPKLHICIKYPTPNSLMLLQREDLTIDINITSDDNLCIPFCALKGVTSIRIRDTKFLNASTLMQMPKLNMLWLNALHDKTSVIIHCGISKFHNWPDLNDIVIRGNRRLVFDILYIMHNSSQLPNDRPNMWSGKAPYIVKATNETLPFIHDYINAHNMQSSFSLRVFQDWCI